jgi:hypothetical protein
MHVFAVIRLAKLVFLTSCRCALSTTGNAHRVYVLTTQTLCALNMYSVCIALVTLCVLHLLSTQYVLCVYCSVSKTQQYDSVV